MRLFELRLRTQEKLRLLRYHGHTYYAGALGPSSTALDLGANRGEFSSELIKLHGCKCFAFEPVSSLHVQIPDSQNLIKLNIAISDNDGECTFYPSADPEAGSILPNATQHAPPYKVPSKRLETILKDLQLSEVDLIKVDIEGAEQAMFDSTSDQVFKTATQITVEFHDCLIGSAKVKQIIRRLESLGFLYLNFAGGKYHADCLFLNKRKLLSPRHLSALLYMKLLKTYLAIRAPADT